MDLLLSLAILSRCYGEDASSTNSGYHAAGYSVELRDTGQYGFLLPPDQVGQPLYEVLVEV